MYMKKIILSFVLLFCSFSLFSQTAGTLTFNVTTVAGGTISGAHIQAIWIVNSLGVYVKTLLSSTSGDKSHLSKFLLAAGNPPNTVDATTGATTSTYTTLTKTWDATDFTRALVADGNYTVGSSDNSTHTV